ncbi:MAG: S49 family peptidase, partial [Propioniciclava sp.]
KLGLIREGINVGNRAGMLTGEDSFTDEEWDVLNQMLDDIYCDFTTKSATDRGMELTDLEEVAKGRVWTGSDAAARGLVDHLGGMSTAIDRACALAELDRAGIQLRGIPSIPFLARLRPAESSESANAMLSASQTRIDTLEAAIETLRTSNPLDVLLAQLDVPGVLTLPWRITIR